MGKWKFVSLLFAITLIASGCSTYGMDRYLAEEKSIDTEKYAYQDENFTYSLDGLRTLTERFRLEELSTNDINTLMEEEIKNGRYNEIIIYLRHLQDEDAEEAASYSARYLEALEAHVERMNEPSEPLVRDAVQLMKQQYELDPEDEERTIRYATLLIHSEANVEKGAELLFDLETHIEEMEEEPGYELLLALAQAYYAIGDYESSLARYEALTSLDPSDPTNFYRMSKVYAAMGDTEGERNALTQAFEPTSEFLGQYGDESYSLYKDYLDTSIE
ncbi:tetratricopeptide repeat protein [Alteribacillus iranensis]|uniref:TPR repeat-containing protein n=1 Tax=Alteribacillus iranensis TaxID=930128 RepID=A0A1I2EGZ5_9BACI|nr:tetratricopeptide repeat protein [Alteribacillus iranensis]SFE92232.1 TPR repeat-containing protein [Alteribacillus iranensis]